MLRYYICRYHINALHSVDNLQSHAHQHTFMFSLYMEARSTGAAVPFSAIDELARNYLLQYQGQYLNSLPRFEGRYPSLEWICEAAYTDLYNILDRKDWQCLQLELAENPLKTFTISDRIMLPSIHPGNHRIIWDKALSHRRRYLDILQRVKEGGHE